MTDQQAAQDWHLGQQAAWLIRRCSQLRPWLQHDRPDVVTANPASRLATTARVPRWETNSCSWKMV